MRPTRDAFLHEEAAVERISQRAREGLAAGPAAVCAVAVVRRRSGRVEKAVDVVSQAEEVALTEKLWADPDVLELVIHRGAAEVAR